MKDHKVFCIGLGKTGTTSLKEAMRILGYRTIRLPLQWQGISDFDVALPGISAAMYEDLDAAYPGSKFILTVRDIGRWLKSVEHDIQRKKDVVQDRMEEREKIQLLLYGTAEFDRKRFEQAYCKHLERVEDYFKKRPDDLLVLDITTDAGWDRLCGFLGEPVPDVPFPHTNKATDLDDLLLRLMHVIRDTGVVSNISKYSTQSIQSIIEGADIDLYDLSKEFILGDDRRINKVLKRASAYFGGAAKAEKALGIPADIFRQAIMRQKEHARNKKKAHPLLTRLRNIFSPH